MRNFSGRNQLSRPIAKKFRHRAFAIAHQQVGNAIPVEVASDQ